MWGDGDDLREADNGKLATARSRTPQLPPCFNEVSHAAKTFFFLPASVLKVKKFQSFPGKLVYVPRRAAVNFLRRTAVT